MITETPITLFLQWYEEAHKLGLKYPNAFTLATCTKDGFPSARILLMRAIDESGFSFFTNYSGRKSLEIKENSNIAACFFWEQLSKQIRIEGVVEKLSQKKSDEYFASRPRGSQIGAWASKQSEAMVDAHDLVARVQKITDQFADQDIPRPPFWGGYKIIPNKVEFWQEGEYRLHKRILYAKNKNGWEISRLYP